MTDLISRADAIEAVMAESRKVYTSEYANAEKIIYEADAVEALAMLPPAEAEPMTEEVREALMRLTMCAREDCVICKYKDKCNFDFQYEESTKNMNTIFDSLMRSKCEVDAKWIPCSERLPSEGGDYLCTIPLDAEENYTEVLMFHKGRFYEDDAEWGATYHDDVLAWMPLPKPYREESEVEE